eukprot:752211-Hanusia_phi.AAC.1
MIARLVHCGSLAAHSWQSDRINPTLSAASGPRPQAGAGPAPGSPVATWGGENESRWVPGNWGGLTWMIVGVGAIGGGDGGSHGT